ncbi:MAG: hypothetical protein JSW47_12385 [Phycisphaerales bacterium]|nr:MAG: hypothetical protein JSW47_12385 [Phycisphaerales bacterium]
MKSEKSGIRFGLLDDSGQDSDQLVSHFALLHPLFLPAQRNQKSSIATQRKSQPSEGPPNYNIEDPDLSGVNSQ